MKLPSPDKRVVDGLSGNTLHLLYYVMGFTGCVSLVLIAYHGTNQYLDLLVAGLIFAVVYSLARYSHLSHKNSAEKVSESLGSLRSEVRDMSIHLRDMSEQLKLSDLGDTIFGKDSFRRVWRSLTLHTEDRFLSMSYMNPSEWDNEAAMSQIKALGAMKSMSDSTIVARRLFVLESEEELSALAPVIEEHQRHQIETRWILRDALVGKSIQSKDDPDCGFNLSDEARGAIYHYDQNRHVSGGRLIFKPSEIREYVGIFEKAWGMAKAPNTALHGTRRLSAARP